MGAASGRLALRPRVSRILFAAMPNTASRRAIISLGRASPRASSDLPAECQRRAALSPWAQASGLSARQVRLFGLADGGVCRAAGVTTRAVRSYRTISPLPEEKDEG